MISSFAFHPSGENLVIGEENGEVSLLLTKERIEDADFLSQIKPFDNAISFIEWSLNDSRRFFVQSSFQVLVLIYEMDRVQELCRISVSDSSIVHLSKQSYLYILHSQEEIKVKNNTNEKKKWFRFMTLLKIKRKR